MPWVCGISLSVEIFKNIQKGFKSLHARKMLHVVAYVNRSISLWNSCKHSGSVWIYSFGHSTVPDWSYTRMHYSRMRATRSSSRLPGGGGLPPCMLGYTTSGVGLETPPRCGPGNPPPQPEPPTSPMGVGLEPPWTEFLTHASENITLPQLRCGR